MQYYYETITDDEDLPIKVFIHSVYRTAMHYHKEMEILWVLKGSVKMRIENREYILKENDIIFVNSNELHNTSIIHDENLILALQIEKDRLLTYYPEMKATKFDFHSFYNDDIDDDYVDVIRYRIARIVWELNKKGKGYRLIVSSELNLLLAYMLNGFHKYFIEEDKDYSSHKDLERIHGIMTYINENLERGVTLGEIAEREDLNPFYLSHFIKQKMGMSYQEYVNNLRLDRATHLLKATENTITEISYASGFPSPKALNRQLKDAYGCTPTQYRERARAKRSSRKAIDFMDGESDDRARTYLDVDRDDALERLTYYLKSYAGGETLPNKVFGGIPEKKSITVKADEGGIPLVPYWKKLTTFSRAAEGLRSSWQDQMREVQKRIGFEYVRFHGIFSDDMMVYNLDENGSPHYNWTYVDELFDFFMKVDIKPFAELGFMPREIQRSHEKMFWWEAGIAPPKRMELWTDMVEAFVRHCINRYGFEEVKTWYFEIWNEPDLEGVFWAGTKEEYFNFYKDTALTIKSISKDLRVGGPAITHQTLQDDPWLKDFLLFCRDEGAPIDFVSLHIYTESYSSEEDNKEILEALEKGAELEDLMKQWMGAKRIYHGRDNTRETLDSANAIIEETLGYRLELHITEWNASSLGRNPIHDTLFVANFIIDNVIDNIGRTDSLGYWTFTDIMEESKAGISPFHGGFGLINNNGLKKPSYYSFYFLNKLGDEVLKKGDGYIVTRKNEDIQILIYNYAYFDELFLKGDTSALSHKERYDIYEKKPPMDVDISIRGLEGRYKQVEYEMNRDNGSVFDEWLKIGSPEDMTYEEIEYLRGKSKPKLATKFIEPDGKYNINYHIPVHGVSLITLEKMY